ncbi:MAG: DMT family transporter [Ardenticatenaceae bacterium]|nr:DMT family transporter [Ardenticatenaceae bacterium]HBY93575.1 hypothetical protein [Chloroflexota bacterium]
MAEATPAGVPISTTADSSRRFLPYLALAFSVVGLGFSAIFVKWANAPGAVSGFYRVAIAAAVLALPFSVQAQRQAPLSKRHIWFAGLGGLFFAGDLAAWSTAVLITSAANATLLANTSPLWVGLGALVLFKEKLGLMFWAGLLLAMLGAVVIFGEDFFLSQTLGIADGLALLAGFCYGMFFLATERARGKLSPLVAWWISAITSTLALLLISVTLKQPLVGYPAVTYWNLIAVALVTQVGSYLSLSYALGHLPASHVAPTLLLQPVLTAILAVPLLGQPLSAMQMVGGGMVLVGIWLVHSVPVRAQLRRSAQALVRGRAAGG